MKNKAKPILCLCCLLLPVTGWAADGWQSLFNGSDLTGWKASENQGGFKVVFLSEEPIETSPSKILVTPSNES